MNEYYLLDRPPGGVSNATRAWEALDDAFGTQEFSRESAASVLTQAEVENEYRTLDWLVSRGYATEATA